MIGMLGEHRRVLAVSGPGRHSRWRRPHAGWVSRETRTFRLHAPRRRPEDC